jgi:gliding motility-associated-like protein
LNNLDKILKQQMQDFAPDAPNIWAGIEQGVQANAAVASKVVVSKMAFTFIKLVAILAIPVAVATYFYLNNSKEEKAIGLLNKAINESSAATQLDMSLEKPLEAQKLKEPAVNATKEYQSNVVDKVTVANPINNFEQIKPIDKEKGNEIPNNQNPEKTVSVAIVNPSLNTMKEVGSDLSEKIEDIENTENLIEANEIGKNVSPIVKIPNVLTPNNDGLNDKYVVEIEGEKLFNLKIYNFNNEMIFESNDKNFTWDGVSQKTGQACNSGIYYGVLNYKFINSDKLQTQMTKIKLIR